jgi:hypothetical protein
MGTKRRSGRPAGAKLGGGRRRGADGPQREAREREHRKLVEDAQEIEDDEEIDEDEAFDDEDEARWACRGVYVMVGYLGRWMTSPPGSFGSGVWG